MLQRTVKSEIFFFNYAHFLHNYIIDLLLDGRTNMWMLLFKKYLDYRISCERKAGQHGALQLNFFLMIVAIFSGYLDLV